MRKECKFFHTLPCYVEEITNIVPNLIDWCRDDGVGDGKVGFGHSGWA